ncbi:MAG: sugar ABC transporter permease [Treponemataceae bacterium]|nr:sugar ABC transporter permease [Treponemataceae bacterium]
MEYVESIYRYDAGDNSYKREAVKGMTRIRLQRIIRKTGYEPEHNRFVGLENYRKIFTGQVGSDFYPHTTRVEKFTRNSNPPTTIAQRMFEREVVGGKGKPAEDVAVISAAYALDVDAEVYRLDRAFNKNTAEDDLLHLPEVASGSVPEAAADAFFARITDVSMTGTPEELSDLTDAFIVDNELSEPSAQTVSAVAERVVEIAELKNALADAWVVRQFNMGVVGFTLFFAVFSVIGINVIAFALALALDTGIRGQKVLRTIFFLPNVLSMVIVALIWSMLFNQLLPSVTGIREWISDSAKTPWLLVLVAVWQGAGYYMIVYLAGLQNIPTDVVEAAKIDGASGWHRFRFITLPLMIPSMTISLFLTIANALKSFDLIYSMIGQQGYATGTVPFVMDIYFDAFSKKQAGLATAKAMVLFLVIVLVTGVQLYTMKRKEVEA